MLLAATSLQTKATVDILSRAREATLASSRSDRTPHASVVWFVHTGLTVYFSIAIDSQKAHNIQHDDHVALEVHLPYDNWRGIRGMTIGGRAHFVRDIDKLAEISQRLLAKYPALSTVIADPLTLPWPGMLFVVCEPTTVSLLDYSKDFGHTEYFSVQPK